MNRQTQSPQPDTVEFWLVDGTLAEPGISFAFDPDVTPPPRPSRVPLRMSVLPRRRRLSKTQTRMS